MSRDAMHSSWGNLAGFTHRVDHLFFQLFKVEIVHTWTHAHEIRARSKFRDHLGCDRTKAAAATITNYCSTDPSANGVGHTNFAVV